METMQSNNVNFNKYLERYKYISGGAITPNWIDDGHFFWFSEGPPENINIYKVDMKSGEKQPIFDVPRFSEILSEHLGFEVPYRGLPFDTLEVITSNHLEFIFNGVLWGYDLITEHLEPLSSLDDQDYIRRCDRNNAKSWMRNNNTLQQKVSVPEQKSHDGQWFAGIRDNDIYLRSTVDGRFSRLTNNTVEGFIWDIEVSLPRAVPGLQIEFNNPNSSSWSPNSLTLLAYRRDITEVALQPRIHWLKSLGEEVENIPWTRAGGKLEVIQPFFIDIRSGVQTAIKMKEVEDRYTHLLCWVAGGSKAILISYTREMKSLDIFIADVKTGNVKLLMSEHGETFVKLQHDVVQSRNDGFNLIPDESGFLWLSTRDGYNHIYHYDMNGSLVSQLSQGDWSVYTICDVRPDLFVYFTAAVDLSRPYDVHVCRVPLKGGEVEQLTSTNGIHRPYFSNTADATVFLDVHSSVDRPYQSDLVSMDGSAVIETLSVMDISKFRNTDYIPPEEFCVLADDGITELWGVIYKPYNFDLKTSYPVIEYIYAGPSIICAQRHFDVSKSKYANMPWALAQLGYVVVCLDARGTPGRSKAFQDTVYHSWAGCQIPDHAGAIQQLCERNSWMDANRVGITGHSWGAYYATLALIQAPHVYHAAVASSSGAYDLLGYAIHEPYLGLPQENRATYDEANLIARAKNLKGKLMMVSATSDHIVSMIRMTHALMEAGISHEYVLLPGAGHSYIGRETDYLFLKLTEWFDRHVKDRAHSR